jgi:protein involved in polysaccharide export with SLBB domain
MDSNSLLLIVRRLGLVLAVALSLLGGGWSATAQPATGAKAIFSDLPPDETQLPTDLEQTVPEAAPGRTNGPAAAPPAGMNSLDDKHRLSPGDKISFQILEDRDPAKSLTVTDSGELDVPYVGRTPVTGKTCRELAAQLKAGLEREYYYRASVVIGLDAASKVRGKIYIWGQVRNQGAIDIPTGENFTVGKAILRAGGFADFANKKKVKLVRTTVEGRKENQELNMVEILEDGRTERDIALQEDDFIIVPSRLVSF